MGFSFFFIFMLLGNTAIVGDIWEHPPTDLASLIEPKVALQQLQVEFNETSLIDLLERKEEVKIPAKKLEQAAMDLAAGDFEVRKRARNFLRAAGERALPYLEKAVKRDDPEARITARNIIKEIQEERRLAAQQDNGYVKKLMAIRALQELKSQASLPALQQIADGGNPTLAKAAEDAVQVIKGHPVKRPEGISGLKKAMQHLPENTAFAAALDFERGSRTQRLSSYMKAVGEAAAKDPQMQMMAPQLSQMEAQMIPGLITVLAKTGNIRIDSITMLVSDDIGIERNSGYVAFIFTGLHDPAMLFAALKAETPNLMQRQEGDLTVYFMNDVAFCSPDKNTFIWALSDANDGHQIAPLTKAWQNDKKAPAEFLTAAFNPVLEKTTRLAAAGRLSEAQKAIARSELNQALGQQRPMAGGRPEMGFVISFMELLLQLVNADQYAARHTKDNGVLLEIESPTPEHGKKLEDQVTEVDVKMRDTMKLAMEKMQQQGQGRPNPMAGMFKDIDLSKPFFTVESQGTTTTVILKAPGTTLSLYPMLFFAMGVH